MLGVLKFADAFIVGPTAIYTDEDTAMEKALNELSGTGNGDAESHPFWDGSWGTEPRPPTKHLLCIFHISKNLYKHLRTLFVSQMEVHGRGRGGRAGAPDRIASHPERRAQKWFEFNSRWWNIVRDTEYSKGPDPFDLGFDGKTQHEQIWKREWAELVSMLPEFGQGKVDEGIAWLTSLSHKKERYAYRYTWLLLTYGIHSTQRGGGPLGDQAGDPLEHEDRRAHRVPRQLEPDDARRRSRKGCDMLAAGLGATGMKIVTSLKNDMTPYARPPEVADGAVRPVRPAAEEGGERHRRSRGRSREEGKAKVEVRPEKLTMNPTTGEISFEHCVAADFGLMAEDAEDPAQGGTRYSSSSRSG